MISKEKVLDLVKSKGPLVPTDITSELKENSFVVGAFLSELVNSKVVKLSHAKLGGSPLYYVETQKHLLSKLYPHLNEKDRRAYDSLKEKEVILDSTQTPLMRTALRNIPDFSKSFKATFKGQNFLFWRWYLSSEEEVKKRVREILKQMFPEEEKKKPEEKPVKSQEPEKKSIEKKESEVPELKKEPKKESNQKKLFEVETDDEFLKIVDGYLNSLDIKIKESKIIKKKKELDLIVQVPSAFGEITYFCKARNKKKSSEGDVAQAFVEGQMKGYPVIYLSCGDVPKKINDLTQTKYKNLKILKI